MTTPLEATQPAQPPPPQTPRPGGGPTVGLTAMVLLTVSAAVIFWAGLSLGSQTSGRTADERAAFEAFSQTYRSITERYIGTPAPKELVEGAIAGMFDVLGDPHSGYLPPGQFGAALDDARGEFEGIGAVMVTEDASDEPCEPIGTTCALRVLDVLVDAPAQAAGLQVDDLVTAVDGEVLAGSTIDDAVRHIRGPRGSEVVLTVQRDGETLDLPITRDTVVSEDVHSAVLADGRVGYLAIDSFGVNAADHFKAALEGQLDAGVEAFIVDVRDDPGGFVDATVAISSQFLDDGVVFWEEDAVGRQTAIKVIEGGLATDPALPMVVLMNGGSASASEILAGSLQDSGRARLLGEPSFGKGTVQEWTELSSETGGFRLSVATWLTRDKNPIDGTGLLPDVSVPATGQRFRASVAGGDPSLDGQLQTAIALLLDQPMPGESPAPSAAPAVSPAAASPGTSIMPRPSEMP